MTDHIATLRAFNAWQRGDLDQRVGPVGMGDAIDALIAEVEKLRINEKVSLEVIKKWRVERMGMVAEIERLRAKLEVSASGMQDAVGESDWTVQTR